MSPRRFRPAVLLSCTTGFLLIAAVVHAGGTHWKEVVSRLEAQGRAARAHAHLHCPWVGTSETFFQPKDAVLVPGKTTTFRATGHFPAKVSLVFHDDEVHVTRSHVSPTHFTAQVSTGAHLLPGRITYDLISPACARVVTPYPAAEVRAGLDWTLRFANGWQLQMRFPPGKKGQATWSGSGHHLEVGARMSPAGPRRFSITFEPSQADQLALVQEVMKAQAALQKSPEYLAYSKQMSAGPKCDPTSPACAAKFKAWSSRLTAASQAVTKKRVALFPKPGPRGVGCNQLEATVDETMRVKAHAKECGDAGALDASGTVRAED